MFRTRTRFFSLCVWPLTACAAHHDSKAEDEPGDDSESASFTDASEAAAVDGGFEAEDSGMAPGAEVGSSPFLGAWTLTGTSDQQCAARSIVAPYASVVSFELAPDAAEAGSTEVLFDTGLGCLLLLAVEGGVAQLSTVPVLCGTIGTPPDLEFTSVQVTASGSSMQITETLSGACSWTIQGTLSR
jgi:hypothetical protein